MHLHATIRVYLNHLPKKPDMSANYCIYMDMASGSTTVPGIIEMPTPLGGLTHAIPTAFP